MQEQPHYNITPEQGWSNLKPILDVELPVNRRSRRFIFFWWTAAALLLMGVGGLSLYKGLGFFSHPLPSGQTAIESPIMLEDAKGGQQPASPNIKTQDVNPSTEPLKTEQNIPVQQEDDRTQITRKDIQSGKTKQQPAPYKTGTPKTKLPIASLHVPVDAIAQNKMEITSQYAIETDRSIDRTTQDPLTVPGNEIQYSESNNTNSHLTDALPGLPFSSFTIRTQTPGLIHPGATLKPARPTNFIDPTLVVSALSGQHGGLGGFAGAGMAMNVSRKISITTTFGHRSFNLDGSVFGFAKTQEAYAGPSPILNIDPTYEGIPIYLDGFEVNSSASYASIIPFVESVRQWQVSSGVKWNFSKRFFAEGGFHFGFKTRVLSQYPIITPDGSSNPTRARIGNYFDRYNIVRSSMTSVYGGAGYKLGRHLDLFANWTYSFESYLLNDTTGSTVDHTGGGRTDYIRGLNLGLRYTL